MSEDIAKFATEHNSQEEEVVVTAWSGAPEGGYQFTAVHAGRKSGKLSFPCSVSYFSLSGKQIETLYRLHLERKQVGLELMNTSEDMMVIDYNGEGIHE